MKSREFAKPFRIADGSHFRLKDMDSAETLGVKSKEHAQEALEKGIERLTKLQEKLYAQDRWAALLILQGMDAAPSASPEAFAERVKAEAPMWERVVRQSGAKID